MTTTETTTPTPVTGERADLLESLTKHRWFLAHTVQGLTDEQARLRPTVSELTLGGLLKHVTAMERMWAEFMVTGPATFPAFDESTAEEWAAEFVMGPDETLAGLLADQAAVAQRTDELVRTLPSLDVAHELPPAPWFEPGARWSARRVVLHVIAEIAQHAGHADVLRETIDGQKSMG
ncbi:DinB family protein [Modestobacter sp. VKM Ac-2984]|uniref:DinB family protein n=1 Tax=Modestobacter sp. VKM Ac-2984 TaxID=3004138 RepID=UPI0022AA6E7A|nr:DinB family protein [Modestobacter sp. VKM Ac-2984]MCZ2817989.1 DinB family protein [Modestobacter sp. VKM Ac-2984]